MFIAVLFLIVNKKLTEDNRTNKLRQIHTMEYYIIKMKKLQSYVTIWINFIVKQKKQDEYTYDFININIRSR